MDYWVDIDRVFSPVDREPLPLVHMTSDWDKLKSILEAGLMPGFCTEFITNGKEMKSAAFPMISLSNMSVEDAVFYQRSYGTLGIALDLSWGQENDFNPVLYLESQSTLTNEIIESFQHIKSLSKQELENALSGGLIGPKFSFIKTTLKSFSHSKCYQGRLVRKQVLLSEKYLYGLEREWRKVINEKGIPNFLVGNEIDVKEKYNSLLSNIRIDFKLNQVKRIIVETEWEQEAVKDILIKKYNVKDIPDSLIHINQARHMPDEG